ncbi:hypothetical protein CGLAMM_07180 [Acetobacteraceae bacterium EV16G]|uniref:SMODS and SLOG-associating 2TM effector domain-containing protein n=1 Tax=Sorlinia euscelidii TaxID=3081148 RepID=A0ABU7U7N8_9PROT
MSAKSGHVYEDHRLAIELRHLLAESDKFVAEQRKFVAEAAKLGRDRWFAPIVVSTSVAAAMGSIIVSLVTHFLK